MSSLWACPICTYKNVGSDDECSMCHNPRKTKAKKKVKKTIQRTLFGGIVDLTGGEEMKKKKTPPPAEADSTKAAAKKKPPPPPTAALVHPQRKNAASRKRKAHGASSSETLTSTSIIQDGTSLRPKEHLHPTKYQQPKHHRHNIEFSYTCIDKNEWTSSSNESKETKIEMILKQVFQLEKLRPLQSKSIATSLSMHDQLIVLATGGGKSLCYQLPACLLGGVTIVISPLIALMQDQVEALKYKFGIPAACISSSQKASENKAILEKLVSSKPSGVKTIPTTNGSSNGNDISATITNNNDTSTACPVLLYITPESIQTERMRRVLFHLYKHNRLAMFAIDEAHCLSSWGHDFRPAYRKLSWLRQEFPKVLTMACTATATPNVIRDIQSILKLENAALHTGSFDRPSIFYKVKYKDTFKNKMKSALQDLVDYIKKWHDQARMESKNCSGIVYVHKRDDTTLIANALRQARIKAGPYHAGLKDHERNQVQNDWSNGTIQVAVATVAFGMGIDLAHVRYVIHWTLPKTLEGFYQESGRAGRDGLGSQSVLYYSQDDARKFQWLIGQQVPKKDKDPQATKKQQGRKLDSLEQMVNYCMKPQCRRNALIKHFGGTPVECEQSCDYCVDPQKIERAIQSAAALSSNTTTRISAKAYGGGDWDGQWTGLHGNEYGNDDSIARDWGECNDVVDGLRITGPVDDSVLPVEEEEKNGTKSWKKKKIGAAGFTSAASVLARYEAIERRENNRNNGFVRFRTKDNGDESTRIQESMPVVPSVQIPEHLRVAAAKATATTARMPPPKPKSTSSDHAAEADKLRAEIAQLDAEREARMAKLMAKYKKKQQAQHSKA